MPVVVLVTEGELNFERGCLGSGTPGDFLDPESLVSDIAARAAEGMLTLVIGSPGSSATLSGNDARPWLTEAARAGRRPPTCPATPPSHIDMTLAEDSATEFQKQFQEGLAPVTCTLRIPSPPPGEWVDPALINVVVEHGGDRYSLLYSDNPDCEHGWYYSDPSTIELCGESCVWAACSNKPPELLVGCEPLGPETED